MVVHSLKLGLTKPQTPITVLLISCLYMATGTIGFVSHLIHIQLNAPFEYDVVLVSLVNVAAIVAGFHMLRRCNWARWLALAWMAFHLVISALRSTSQLVVHSLLLVIFACLLFRLPASRYFTQSKQEALNQ